MALPVAKKGDLWSGSESTVWKEHRKSYIKSPAVRTRPPTRKTSIIWQCASGYHNPTRRHYRADAADFKILNTCLTINYPSVYTSTGRVQLGTHAFYATPPPSVLRQYRNCIEISLNVLNSKLPHINFGQTKLYYVVYRFTSSCFVRWDDNKWSYRSRSCEEYRCISKIWILWKGLLYLICSRFIKHNVGQQRVFIVFILIIMKIHYLRILEYCCKV